jgi:hypothetical protein
MRVVKAAGVTIAIVFVVNAIITLGSGIPLLVSFIVAVAPCLFGTVIGALVYYLAHGLPERRRYVRFVSSILSGLLATALNWLVVGRSIPELSSMTGPVHTIALAAIVYTCIIAGLVGLIFGSGVGQIARNEDSED